MSTISATRRPGPTYPKDKAPCTRCGILCRRATPGRSASGMCKDCSDLLRMGGPKP